MPTKTAASEDAKPFDHLEDETQYSVTLLKAKQYGRTWLRPSADGITLKGKVVKEIADAVGDVRKIAD